LEEQRPCHTESVVTTRSGEAATRGRVEFPAFHRVIFRARAHDPAWHASV